jgi:hypothetical protein
MHLIFNPRILKVLIICCCRNQLAFGKIKVLKILLHVNIYTQDLLIVVKIGNAAACDHD